MTLWPLCCELENSWFRFLMSRTCYKTLSFEEFDYTLFCVFLNLLFTYMSALVFGTYLLGIHNDYKWVWALQESTTAFDISSQVNRESRTEKPIPTYVMLYCDWLVGT